MAQQRGPIPTGGPLPAAQALGSRPGTRPQRGVSQARPRPDRPLRIVRVPMGERARDQQVAADTDPAAAETMEVLVTDDELALMDPEAAGQVLSDCLWCQYGKPAVAGAVAGGAIGYLAGFEDPAKCALYGLGAGLAYGWYRG